MKLFLLIPVLSGATVFAAAQCASSPFFQQGKQIVYLAEMPNFNHNPSQSTAPASTKTIKETFVVKSVKSQGGNMESIVDVAKWEDSSDPNAKNPLGNVLSAIICTGHSFQYIYNVNMSGTALSDTLEFPFNMKVGDNLPTKTKNVSISRGNGQTINLAINISYSVAAMEEISTPAGKWSCFKVVQTSSTQMPAMGKYPGGASTQTLNMWVAAGIGLIKSQFGTNSSVTLQSL